jgi:hypothetical protein
MEIRGRTIGNDGALDDRTQELGAFREPEAFETASNGVDETEPGSLPSEV